MPVITHRKLVRDLIPDIIRASGKTCRTEILTEEAYLAMLEKKLQEELKEYLQSGDMEEIADLLEVIQATVRARGSSMEEVEAIRRAKKDKRGGFEEKILLIDVTEE